LLPDVADERMAAIQWGVVIGASLVAAVADVRIRRIPNAVTFPLLAGGLVRAIWIGALPALADAIVGCVLLALPYVLLFLFAHGGAGDAKLMAAIGAWLGVAQGLIVLFYVAIAGMVLALVKAIAQKRFKRTLINTFILFYNFLVSMVSYLMGFRTKQYAAQQAGPDPSSDSGIPYGVAIFTGVCVAGGFLWIW